MADTEISALPDSGALAATDLFAVSRAGVGYKVAASRLVYKDASGNVGIGTTAPVTTQEVSFATAAAAMGATGIGAVFTRSDAVNDAYGASIGLRAYLGKGGLISAGGFGMALLTYDGTTLSERARIDTSGNLLVGVTSGTDHTIQRNVATNAGNVISRFAGSGSEPVLVVRSVASGSLGNVANTALSVNKDNTTGRTINAAGTINASGADYAEYVVKAAGCGPIAKGDVCGVDRDGRLTRSWAAAVRYVVKSTNPNLVGGDDWSDHLPPRPVEPGEAPIEPDTPGPRPADEAELDAWAAAVEAYPAAMATHAAEMDDWTAADAAYREALPAWEAALEAARQTVDRIAFCGQVPVDVDADTLAACAAALADGEAVYLVAVARGGGIGAAAVRERDMTLPLYMRRFGAVWAIRDGRPIIDVQHG